MTSESAPRLPPELEHEVFQMAAALHPTTLTALLRVAKRVYAWLEPELYRQLVVEYITNDDGAPQNARYTAFFTAASIKPELFRSGPHTVALAEIPGDPVQLFGTLLCCSQLRLAVGGGILTQDVKDIISQFQLHRLATQVELLFDAADATAYASRFLYLTHLEVFEGFESLSQPFVLALPALTHLAFTVGPQEPSNDVDKFLERIPRLRVCVLIWGLVERGADLLDPMPQLGQRVHDPRVVVASYHTWWEAVSEIDNFWERAEGLIDRKRRKEVAADYLWAK
ncbi:hypothetical protein MKEN_00225900 [Mycena kentingensis (nom. inval.)]|nr:hypothetical protein MKEN_00225900 [Mycena kentingensis (nom. inval.)]